MYAFVCRLCVVAQRLRRVSLRVASVCVCARVCARAYAFVCMCVYACMRACARVCGGFLVSVVCARVRAR